MALSCCLSPHPQLSPYPVILSLENHCGLEQQAVMAHHLRTILGDALVTQGLDMQNPEELPSPEVMNVPDSEPGWGRSGRQSVIRPCRATSVGHLHGSGPHTSLCPARPTQGSPCPPPHSPTPLCHPAYRVPAISAIPTSKAFVDASSPETLFPAVCPCQAMLA